MIPGLPDFTASADVVVVGSGIAGLTVALDAAAAGRSVVLITKGAPADANTTWAQGGVAVVQPDPADRDPGDTVAAHVQDTLVAGAGLSDADATAVVLGQGPGAVERLRARGTVFDAGPRGLLRTREGGHTANRVVHAGGDATGAEIERALLAAPGLPAVLADHQALDVLLDDDGRAVGVSVLAPAGAALADPELDGLDGIPTIADPGDRRPVVGHILARSVVLATGGAGHLYAVTTNPAVATGDGLAMALRAGAALADVEFMQFHPTALWTGPFERGSRPLVTEAVRGEGAVLVDTAGHRIMAGVHPLADLAPRDVVALAISRSMAGAGGSPADHVYLDATGIPADVFRRRFPTVTGACRAVGVDPATDPIPVAPAAHYHCGGVLTDLNGRTTVPGLYAVGEVARTGLHGANRLASNSLLEGLVMGERVAADLPAAGLAAVGRAIGVAPGSGIGAAGRLPLADPAARLELQLAMSASVAIGRDSRGLGEAAAVVRAAALTGWVPVEPTREAVEAANLSLAAGALVAAAADRAESRGCHVRVDHPGTDVVGRSTVIRLQDGEFVVHGLEPARVSA